MTKKNKSSRKIMEDLYKTPDKINVSLSVDVYDHKPIKREITKIQTSIIKNKHELTIEDFAKKVGEEGYTALLGLYLDKYKTAKKEHPIYNQQVLMIDIDNEKRNQQLYTIEDCLAEPFTQKYASFIYKTASHTERLPKFRIVFILQKQVKSKTAIQELYKNLIPIYKMADTSTGQPSRLFFGSNKGIIPINDFKNSINPFTLIPNFDTVYIESLKIDAEEQLELQDKLSEDNKEFVPIEETTQELEITSEIKKYPIYRLLKEYNNTYLTKQPRKRLADQKRIKEIISEKWSKIITANQISIINTELKDFTESEEYLYTLNMRKFLGFPEGTFRDIFHTDNTPSSTVFKHRNGKKYVYVCHSESHEFMGNILQVMVKLVPNFFTTYVQANDFMCELLNIKVKNKGEIGRQKRTLDDFANAVMSAKLQTKYPLMENFIGKKKEEMFIVCNYFQSLIMENQLMTHISQATLLERLNDLDINVHFTEYSVKKIVNKLLMFDILEIVPPEKQSQYIKDAVATYSNKNYIRNVNVMRVKATKIKNHLPKIEQFCKELYDKKQAPSTVNAESLARTFGDEKREKIHPQAYTTKLSKISKIKMSERDSNLTEKQVNRELYYREVLQYYIKELGYVLESEVVGMYQQFFKRNIYTCVKQIGKFKWELYETYCIERIKVSKEVIAKLDVPEQWLQKYLLIPLDLAEELELIPKKEEGE